MMLGEKILKMDIVKRSPLGEKLRLATLTIDDNPVQKQTEKVAPKKLA